MVDDTDIPEVEHEREEEHRDKAFRRFSAIYVGVVAMLLAISALGGGKATKEMISASIRVSDTYSFAQAKYDRQTSYDLAAAQLEAQLAEQPTMPDAAKASLTALIDKYRNAAVHYASDPSTGEGRKELLAKAKEWEKIRDHAEAQDPNFQFAAAFFQIAIVLASVAITANSRALLGLSAAAAGVATLLGINGYFLLVALPTLGA
jgi:hypothetical protein